VIQIQNLLSGVIVRVGLLGPPEVIPVFYTQLLLISFLQLLQATLSLAFLAPSLFVNVQKLMMTGRDYVRLFSKG
jgi:hypothetical protein